MKLWRSLRLRLIFSYVALALLLLTFAGYIFSNALSMYAMSVQSSQQAMYLRQAMNLLGEAQRKNLSGDTTLAFLQQNLPDLHIEMEKLEPEKRGISHRVFTTPAQTELPSGNVLSFSLTDEAPLSLQPGRVFVMQTSKLSVSSFTLPLVTGEEGSSGTLYRFTLSPSTFAFLSNLYSQVLAVLGLALVLAVIIGWLLSHWLSRPLSRLVAATEAVAGGNFLETVDRSGIVELDRLGEQFNRMVLYLRESFRSLAMERDTAKRFAADAAHELKTPVATLQAFHDVLKEHPERLQQVTPAVDRQIKRMEQVITGLLQIANLVEDSDISLELTDLCAVMNRLKPVYQALAEENGQRLTTTCPQAPLRVLANQHLLELTLDNLMDNACKYTEPGGEVAFTLRVDGQEAVFLVQDSGRGITPEELPYIFDRFHRGVDTQSIPGTGLGLAIAQEAVKRMGGTLVAESEPGHGSRFSICLPLLSVKGS